MNDQIGADIFTSPIREHLGYNAVRLDTKEFCYAPFRSSSGADCLADYGG